MSLCFAFVLPYFLCVLDDFPAKAEKPFLGIKRTLTSTGEEVLQQEERNSCCNPTRQSFTNASNDSQQEGKFLIQVSFEKLRRVEDHESCLRRSVLINNTLKLVHSEIYGVKSPFGLTSALSTNLDTDILSNTALPPPRKRRKRYLNDTNPDACPCRRKPNDADNFVQNCERCTLSQVLNEELEDDVFQSDCLHLDKEPSIFSELDSVFHSFVCALET